MHASPRSQTVPAGRTRRFIETHPILGFLTIAYGSTAFILAITLLSDIGLGVFEFDLPGVAPFIVMASAALVTVAFVVVRVVGTDQEATGFRRRVFDFRVNPAWFPLALLLFPLIAVATAVVALGGDPLATLVIDPGLLVAIAVESLIAFALINWWEEAAWSGFALHRLQPRIGPLWSSVVVTWMQATVHLPLVFVVDGVTTGRVDQADVPFYVAALFLLPIPVRLIITWFYNSARNSVPVVGLLHAGLGVATGSMFIPSIASGLDTVWVYAGFAVTAGVLLALTRGQLGYRRQKTSPNHVPGDGEPLEAQIRDVR